MTENEREKVGCVHKNEASPVLALMVQMRLGKRMLCMCVCVCGGRERDSEDVEEYRMKGSRQTRAK